MHSKVHFYKIKENHVAGSNLILKTVYLYLNTSSSREQLPNRLFAQLDNCSIKNKIKYLMFWLLYLVAARDFDILEVRFLPMRHSC